MLRCLKSSVYVASGAGTVIVSLSCHIKDLKRFLASLISESMSP